MEDVEKYCLDALWHLAQPLLPAHPERHQGGGRRRTDDRAMLAAIVYVLESGCAWRKLPGSFPVHWRMVDGITPVRQPVGRPRKRPAKLHGDKGYDYPECREL